MTEVTDINQLILQRQKHISQSEGSFSQSSYLQYLTAVVGLETAFKKLIPDPTAALLITNLNSSRLNRSDYYVFHLASETMTLFRQSTLRQESYDFNLETAVLSVNGTKQGDLHLDALATHLRIVSQDLKQKQSFLFLKGFIQKSTKRQVDTLLNTQNSIDELFSEKRLLERLQQHVSSLEGYTEIVDPSLTTEIIRHLEQISRNLQGCIVLVRQIPVQTLLRHVLYLEASVLLGMTIKT